jgi:probable addiction module antidote protein
MSKNHTIKIHDEAVIEMLGNDTDFAAEYLRVAFEEMDEEDGEVAFLAALRHVVEARGGMSAIAERSGLSRESLYRALSPNGNPTLKTLSAVIHATGLKFADISHAA